MQRTTYTAIASIQGNTCDQVDVSTFTTATTAHGIPEPVRNARVVNNTDSADCVFQWEHGDYYGPNIVMYEIIALAPNQARFKVEGQNSTSSILTRDARDKNTFRLNLLTFTVGSGFQLPAHAKVTVKQ